MRIEDLMSIQEAAAHLNISRSSVYYAIDAGRIQVVDVAGRKMLKRDDVVKYQPAGYKDRRPSIRQSRKKAQSESA